jgi:hypothetical protein
LQITRKPITLDLVQIALTSAKLLQAIAPEHSNPPTTIHDQYRYDEMEWIAIASYEPDF